MTLITRPRFIDKILVDACLVVFSVPDCYLRHQSETCTGTGNTMAAIFTLMVLISSLICVKSQKKPHFVGDRSVIVELFEWKFTDIAKECLKYLGPNGFGGVQVSPVTENRVIKDRPWFERYQPVSYVIDNRSGDQKEFELMVKKCNEANVRVYVDVVLNHMAGGESEILSTGGTLADPTKLKYPRVPYNGLEFHENCKINQGIPESVENCRLDGFPDLDQSNVYVRQILVEFLNNLIKIGVAGFHIAHAKYINTRDLQIIYSRLDDCIFYANCRPFIYQEVDDMGAEAIIKDDYAILGIVTEFRYGLELSNAFSRKTTLHSLLGIGPKRGFLPSSDALVFVDNHSTQREFG